VTRVADQDVSLSANGTSEYCNSGIDYEWDFGDGSSHENSANATHRYLTAGNYIATVTARCHACPSAQRSTVVNITVNEGIHLVQHNYPGSSGPQQIKEHQTAWITADPEMPDLRATIPGETGMVIWTLRITDTYLGTLYGDYSSSTLTIPATQEWDIYATELWHDNFMGGLAFLTATLANGQQRGLSFNILARNPLPDAVTTHVDSIQGRPWFASAILRHESQYQQFDTAGYPYKGNNGSSIDWGVAQINDVFQTVTRQVVWNWKNNAEKGVQVMNDVRSEVPAYFNKIKWGFSRVVVPASTI
jgi:PKD repeat protein